MRTPPLRSLAATPFAVLVILSGCAGAPPDIPPVPEAQGCAIIDPATIKAEPTAGPGLKALLPQAGPGRNLPRTVPALLTTRGEPSRIQWQALPPTADAALVQAMQDAERPPVERARAISGLAIRQNDGSGPQIAALLADAKTDAMVRRAAVRGLASGFIETSETALVAALNDPDPMLREAAVKALTPHATRPAIQAALRARQGAETAPLVKEALDAALKSSTP
jgi:hypothetical protein